MRKSDRLLPYVLLLPLVIFPALFGCGDKSKETETAAAEKVDAALAPPKNKTDRGPIPAPPDVAAAPADAQKTTSGLPYKVLKKGTGNAQPNKNDSVKVHYTGWKTDGKMYRDTTRSRPVTMPLPRLGPGWVEALTGMTIGEKRRLWMSPELANRKGKPPRTRETIVYDIELMEVMAAPPIPTNLKEPAKEAKTTKSKLSHLVLKPGTGKDAPNPWDRVRINYSIWDTEGTMIDSTITRGRASTIQPSQRGAGWEEALATMTVGQKSRFWIPAALNQSSFGAKAVGTVVDIELIDIKSMPKPPETPKNVAAPPRNAKKTKKGVHYLRLSKGTDNKKPREWDTVTVHYTGWTTDGKMFDSSVTRGRPATFSLRHVIAGWTDALQQLTIGEKARLWIPEELAYKGQPGKPKGMLVFDVELISIKEMPKPPDPPKTPKDVAAPPANAQKTAKGVSYRVLNKGKGGPKPKATDSVTVHYSGWTTDGKMFDSSVTRGRPATFGLGQVIAGWTDGLQIMSVGDKVRFWIPEALAYQGKPGKPKGMLVFDVELLEIKSK